MSIEQINVAIDADTPGNTFSLCYYRLRPTNPSGLSLPKIVLQA